MKKSILIAAIALFFVCCGRSVNPVGSDIAPGLLTPVLLNPTETVVVLDDYVLPNFEVTKAEAIGYNISIDAENRLLFITKKTETTAKLTELKLTVGGRILSILMIASEKEPVTFSIPNKGYKSVKFKGEFNAWNPNTAVATLKNGVWSVTIDIAEGEYQYCVVIDGVDQPDPTNPATISNGMGGTNNLIAVGHGCGLPPQLFTISAKNQITIDVENSYDDIFVFWQNTRLDNRFLKFDHDGRIHISIPRNARCMNRSFIRVFAHNEAGISNDLFIPLQHRKVIKNTKRLTRTDFHRLILYSLMTDRFYDGDPDNNRPLNQLGVNWKADWFGGDFAGITKKIEDGYFQQIGVNTIWLSPITVNPPDAWGLHLSPITRFSGYHGYWPIYLTVVDPRFGTKEELQTLLQTAHNNNMNVILDYAANHVHENSPFIAGREHWITPLYLPDGTRNLERWDDHRLTTWFDTFLPKFDFEQEEVSAVLSDSLLFWVENFAFDGFRHDASKHIHERFWRAVTLKMKQRIHRPIYQIGETYGSPELIKSYVNSGMMDAQFDFNLYDALVTALIDPNGSFVNLNKTLLQSLKTYGYHNLMGNITGNHDRGRFISYAGGTLSPSEDSKIAGWTREITVGDPIAYKKLQLLHAFIFTVPGVPTLYQGDEFGQPGGNDPDNRRWMQFDNLNDNEMETRKNVEKLTHFRMNSMPLIYGKYVPLFVEDDILVFGRFYFGETVIVGLNKSNEDRTVEFWLPSVYGGTAQTLTIGANAHSFAF